jgi:hypothetical protein
VEKTAHNAISTIEAVVAEGIVPGGGPLPCVDAVAREDARLKVTNTSARRFSGELLQFSEIRASHHLDCRIETASGAMPPCWHQIVRAIPAGL